MSVITEQYSGIVLNQNQKPIDSTSNLNLLDGNWRIQEFFLPSNFIRGTDDEEITPALSGWQLLVSVEGGQATTATLDWRLEYDVFGIGWIKLTEGTTSGAFIDGNKVWFDMYFEAPLDVSGEIATSRFRLSFRSRVPVSTEMLSVISTGSSIQIEDTVYALAIVEGQSYPLNHDGIDGFVYWNASEDTITWEAQQGITAAWFSVPNPLALSGSAKAYNGDGVTPLTNGADQYSFCFRVLALTADDGTDFLGNTYRAVVVNSDPQNVSTVDGDADKIWTSKPNPSRFAVESLYFDVRSADDSAVVVDRVLLDPVTTGVYFSVYYSSEGDPGTTESEWENKLWDRVPLTFRATQRDAHALPQPIVAKYIKIEFTHLQAKSYSAGDFAKPISYKKHPKWVLDYFLARLSSANAQGNGLIANRVAVVFDALDLAYNYYLDDLAQEPLSPIEVDASYIPFVQTFLNNQSDQSDQVDPITLQKISLALAPYQSAPSTFASSDYILGQIAQQGATQLSYPTEGPPPPGTSFDDVDQLRDEAVVIENDWPVMFFYLTCRHKYREIVAPLTFNRAYFVGIREIAFLRDNYTTASDTNQYIESGGDEDMMARNDFITDHGIMTV